MKAIYLLLLAATLAGCSSQWHLRKAISKDPSILTEGVVIERVTDTITVITPEIKVDTVHAWSVDTVTTYVDRVRIRTKVDTVARTVYVDVICPADTIYIPHTYDRTVIRPEVKKGLPWSIIIVMAFICLAIVLLGSKR
jgi:hypothetical protein